MGKVLVVRRRNPWGDQAGASSNLGALLCRGGDGRGGGREQETDVCIHCNDSLTGPLQLAHGGFSINTDSKSVTHRHGGPELGDREEEGQHPWHRQDTCEPAGCLLGLLRSEPPGCVGRNR